MIYNTPNFSPENQNDDLGWNKTSEHDESIEEATHRIEEKFDKTVMSLSEDQEKFEVYQIKRNKLLAFLREQYPDDFRQYKLYDLLAGGLEPKSYIHFDFPQPYSIEDFVNDHEHFDVPEIRKETGDVNEITAERMRASIDEFERK